MSKARKFLEAVGEYGTVGEIRNLERKLGIQAADMSTIPDMYDYLAELKDKAKDKGINYKLGAKEDLWPASQPGPGQGAQTQLSPK